MGTLRFPNPLAMSYGERQADLSRVYLMTNTGLQRTSFVLLLALMIYVAAFGG